ncbi:MAG: iron ABC transporter permease [Nitrospinaceae bacterium]|nr:iron ABC transporter permease [Nitrospinaceae bacterium]
MNIINRKQYISIIFLFFLFFLITISITPLIGSVQIDLGNAFSRDLAFNDNVDANILFLARIPRIILAALTGAALSVAGAILQSLLRNDLAAPFTLGVSSGAALGAVIAISLGLPYSIAGIPTIPIAAFLGSLGAISLVFSLARTRTGDFPTPILLLAGVTANFFFAALVMLIHYLSDFTQSFRIVRWLMGGLDITSYKTLLSISPMIFIGFAVLIFYGRDFNVMSTGIQSAMSRGVEVIKVQKIGFIMASLLTGAVVSLSGPIGFVGLIVPHIVRLIVGPDLRILLPASIFFGASFLIICDTLARTLIAPTEIPVGIITAMLGGPFFVWLLKRPKS